MVEEERAKVAEAQAKALIQIQSGDIEVAKLQLAARWAEMGSESPDEWMKAFARLYKAIDETVRL